jgi:hypothetical protein
MSPSDKENNASLNCPQWMLDDLSRSGLLTADIAPLGWHHTDPEVIQQLTGVNTQGIDGYAIPFYDPKTGTPLTCPDGRPYVRVKLQSPLPGKKGDPMKYVSPKKGGQHALIIPWVHNHLANHPDAPVYVTEGEKKAVCAVKHDIPCIGLVGNWGWLRSKEERLDGADALTPELALCLANRTVMIVWDSDATADGDKATEFATTSARLAAMLEPLGSRLFRVDLPSLNGSGKVGLDDYIVAGHSGTDFLNYVGKHKASVSPRAKGQKQQPTSSGKPAGLAATSTAPEQPEGKPVVALPNGPLGVSISNTAANLAALFSAEETVYCRCPEAGYGQVVFLDAGGHLHSLTPAQACSEFETVAQLVNLSTDKNQNVIPVPALCNETTAKTILAARPFVEGLPPIRLISRCPVLVDRGGRLETVTGYDRQTGIMAKGQPPPSMDLPEARLLLLDLVAECDFTTPADKSRYLANAITPAIIMGQLAQFRAPIQYIEADLSQAGKGYLNKITAAIYNDEPAVVTQQKEGGVGSMREKFDSWLIDGRVFISFDNLTQSREGAFNSEELCAFMTEDMYMARALRTSMRVSPRFHVVMATTNGCTLITDLVNRSCPVAIRKRLGHQYRHFPEGDLLAHVKGDSAKYLGAVFAVVRAWYEAGRPSTAVTAHESSFNGWAQALDWIVQNVMGLPPLLDGYAQTRERMTSPDLMWLRDLAQAVKVTGRLNDWLIATDLAEIAAMQGLKISDKIGVIDSMEDIEGAQLDSVRKQMGAKLSRCFKFHSCGGEHDRVLVDTFLVEKSECERKASYDYGKEKNLKSYRFTVAVDGFGASTPEPSEPIPEPGVEPGKDQVEPGEPGNPVNSHSSESPPSDSGMEITGTLGSPGSEPPLLGSDAVSTDSSSASAPGQPGHTGEPDGLDEAGVFL